MSNDDDAERDEGDPREELARVAASLRAYLEWQQATGAGGIPRRAKGEGARLPAPPPIQEPVEVRASERASVASESVTAPMVQPTWIAPNEPIAPPEKAAIAESAPDVAPPKSSPSKPRPLPVIDEEVRGCTKCDLSKSRTHTAFSRGNPEAKLCFIGEAPGADEDEQGIPFVGRAGQLLDRMIGAMGLDPERDTYVCNIIKCRPPGNRRPEPFEIEACMPYLHEQLAVVEPKVIVALGNTAVAALINTKMGITKIRGSWKLYRGRIPVMPTYHPSYLLRPSAQQAEAKKHAWEDLQAVMRELGLPVKK